MLVDESLSELRYLTSQPEATKASFSDIAIDSLLKLRVEVVAPLLYTLSLLPSASVTVFRTQFAPGFHEMAAPFYQGHFLPSEALFNPAILSNLDVIFLTSSEHCAEALLSATNGLRSYPHIKLVLVTHRVSYWDMQAVGPNSYSSLRWPHRAAFMSHMASHDSHRDLAVLALSPHVTAALKEKLHKATNLEWSVDTFVPVSLSSKNERTPEWLNLVVQFVPNILPRNETKSGAIKTAVIQGDECQSLTFTEMRVN